ncbi:MAG: porphobilinogen synthase [Alphaproteobacteria bacterium]
MERKSSTGGFPAVRMRRNRSHGWVRRLVGETRLSASDLVLPIFLRGDEGVAAEIGSLPGVLRLTLEEMLGVAEEARELGISALAFFPWVEASEKDASCSLAVDSENLVCRAVRLVKSRVSGIGIICDVALDPYNSLGHDGLVGADGIVLNDETNALLGEQALVLAGAGADVVAPSDMMDGRVGVIRASLEGGGFRDVKILSYAAKYASSLYGPFREAVGSGVALTGDKRTYQMDFANGEEALREVMLDIGEGADMVMVKPGLPYLDIIWRVKECFGVPVFGYQVSGEYAMLRYASDVEGGAGAIDWEGALLETLMCFRRAGADGIFTYGALEAARLLRAGAFD